MYVRDIEGIPLLESDRLTLRTHYQLHYELQSGLLTVFTGGLRQHLKNYWRFSNTKLQTDAGN